MTHTTQSFVVADPRTFDGDPYEVAARAASQIEGVIRVLDAMLPPTILMIRNAELERQINLGQNPDVQGYDESLQGRKWSKLQEDVATAKKDLAMLRQVAAYNPKAPIKG